MPCAGPEASYGKAHQPWSYYRSIKQERDLLSYLFTAMASSLSLGVLLCIPGLFLDSKLLSTAHC